MKKNCDGSTSLQYIILRGNTEIVKTSSKKMTAYVTNLEHRPLYISNGHVKSSSRSNLKKVAHVLSSCLFKAVITFPNDKEKVAALGNTKIVTRRGMNALRISLSSEKFDAFGSYANKATSFDDLKNGNYDDMTILFWEDDFDDDYIGDFFNRGRFQGQVIRNRDFSNQNLSNENFSGSDLTGSNFTNANLTNANFRESDLRGSNFTNAILTNANFRGSNIRREDVINIAADITGARF
jgi:uncharacterized protein YjbI with pentapeptide repeats